MGCNDTRAANPRSHLDRAGLDGRAAHHHAHTGLQWLLQLGCTATTALPMCAVHLLQDEVCNGQSQQGATDSSAKPLS